uniref:hypothetical protein n=1 Tax=Aeromonas taiwanensis TaxID=633417 RepID=UPI003BA0890C
GLDPNNPAHVMQGQYVRYYDDKAHAPWLWNEQKKVFLSTEDEESLTSSPTLALRVTGGGFPLLGDSCSRSTGFLLHRAA